MPTKKTKAPAAPAPVAIAEAAPLPLPLAVPPAPHPPVLLPYPIGGWRILFYFACFLQPGIGLAVALLYWQGPDRRTRRFARWCIALAALGWCVSSAGGLLPGMDGEKTIQPW